MPKPGESVRADCIDCATEFEVVLEPKVKEGVARAGTLPAQKVQFCPFCGGENVEAEED